MKDQRSRAIIIAIGNELLSGSTVDTNSRFLSRYLAEKGVRTQKIVTVPDSIPDITLALGDAISRAEIVFCSGGLGPTSDDITRNALAEFDRDNLIEDAEALARMREKYRMRGVPENRVSLRQVTFPSRSEILPNSFGTADAFLVLHAVNGRSVPIVALPGVPREFEGLVSGSLGPLLDRFLPIRDPIQQRSIRLFGLPESLIGEKIETLTLPRSIELSYRAFSHHVLVSLIAREPCESTSLDVHMKRVEEILGADFIVGRDERTGLAEFVAEILSRRNETVAFGESCTGGKLCDLFVSIPGASRFTAGGVVAYTEQAKAKLLDVSAETLAIEGAVSAACAAEMAQGARTRFASTYGVAATGFAGPTGGNHRYPVGTLFVAVASAMGVDVKQHTVPRERESFRSYSALLALQLLRAHLH